MGILPTDLPLGPVRDTEPIRRVDARREAGDRQSDRGGADAEGHDNGGRADADTEAESDGPIGVLDVVELHAASTTAFEGGGAMQPAPLDPEVDAASDRESDPLPRRLDIQA